MEKNIKKYLKTEYAKGASPFARIMDIVGLRVVIFTASYFAYLTVTRRLLVSLLLAGITTFAASLIFSRLEAGRFEKFARTYLEKLRETAMLEELTILPEIPRSAFFEKMVLRQLKTDSVSVLQEGYAAGDWYAAVLDKYPENEATEQDILLCLRGAQKEEKKRCLCISTGGYTEKAKTFAGSLEGYSFRLLGGNEILSFATEEGCLPDENRILQKIERQMQERKMSLKKMKAEVLGKSKFRTYIATAAVMAVLYVLFHFQPFFLSMAAICAMLAAFTAYTNSHNKTETN